MGSDRHAIFLNGPIGSGKTTLGQGVAQRLGAGFIDGDDYSDPNRPWYCSIHTTSKAIVRTSLAALKERRAVVVAYPLGCAQWIYFRRCLSDAGVRTRFVSLRACYSSIVAPHRNRNFSSQERQRIKAMIAEGYGERGFSDLVFDTDRQAFALTLDNLEAAIRALIASPTDMT